MNQTEAEKIAFDFLMDDLEILEDDRDWFTMLSCRLAQGGWYTVEVGIEGLPDKWVLQVFDTGICDPCYTFFSPIKAADGIGDLESMPESIAAVLVRERQAA